jgi:hypothetical protein
MATREAQWQSLYDDLLSILSEFGVDDAEGSGDFWIVDDDWGGYDQKLYISEASFWTDAICTSVQRLLATNYPYWRVFVVFAAPVGHKGQLIYAGHFEQEADEEYAERMAEEMALRDRMKK